MSRYDPLRLFLESTKQTSVRLTFSEIEGFLGRPLPKTARSRPAWWSNNTQGHSQARAWVTIGWQTEQVDVVGETVVFRKVVEPEAVETKGMQEMTEPFAHQNFESRESANAPVKSFADVYGSMKGTVTFAPGVNADAPLISTEEWDAMLAEMEAEWDELYGPFIELPEAKA